MIKKLKYYVQFPTNSITLQNDLSFEPGITAVTGENGSGKTFGSIEMIRYMLFGKKALRGPAADYKTLDAEMEFEIAGSGFTVSRNRKREQLVDSDGNTLAVGAEAVNQRITQELGFSIEVFDLACAALQKQSDRLSQMGSAARKRLIDEIVGLNSNEAVEKECKEEAKLSEREAEALRSTLSQPVEPSKPKNYRRSEDIEAELSDAICILKERERLSKLAEPVRMPAPPSGDRPCPSLISELEAHQQSLQEQKQERALLEAQRSSLLPEVYSREQLDAAESWLDFRAEMARRGPKPRYAETDLHRMSEIHSRRSMLAKAADVTVTCPKCEHEFRTDSTMPEEPELRPDEIQAELLAISRWALPLAELEEPEVVLDLREIADHRSREGNDAKIEGLDKKLAVALLEDRSQEMQHLKLLERQWRDYDAAVDRLAPMVAAAEEAQRQLEALPDVKDRCEELCDALVEAKVYENELSSFEKLNETFLSTSAKISERTKRASNFREGAKALAETRKILKGFLAPSLSRVASALISDMTGGVLTSVIVDDEMNIAVDGQDISTLSGAGATVANLALRLALGQVLVRERFPVFIADEADSDMSASRAQFTMDCLASMKNSLKQVFVITHKPADFADHIIEML